MLGEPRAGTLKQRGAIGVTVDEGEMLLDPTLRLGGGIARKLVLAASWGAGRPRAPPPPGGRGPAAGGRGGWSSRRACAAARLVCGCAGGGRPFCPRLGGPGVYDGPGGTLRGGRSGLPRARFRRWFL